MARKDLDTITKAQWIVEQRNWKNDVRKFKQNNPGTSLCWHNFQRLKDVDLPSGLQAEVEYPFGKTNEWAGKDYWEVCIKCGKVKTASSEAVY